MSMSVEVAGEAPESEGVMPAPVSSQKAGSWSLAWLGYMVETGPG